MRLLDRYLLRELLVPLGFCLSGFLILWISADLLTNLDDLQQLKLTVGDMAQYYAVKMPGFLVFVLPLALLLALLFALTAHARHYELTAARAAGVSLWRLSAPYFAVGFLASLVVFALNEFWVPEIGTWTDRIEHRRTHTTVPKAERQIKKDFGFTCAPEGKPRTWFVGTYHVGTGEMLKVQLDWTRPDGTRLWLTADRAVFTNGSWRFYHALEFRENPAVKQNLAPSLRTNVMALPEISETPEEIRSAIRISERLSKLGGGRNVDMPIKEILDYLRLHPHPSRTERNQIYTKLHGRLAEPWTCLVVVLIALPFGAASGRRNVFVGVAASILICFAYFVVKQVGLLLGAGGLLPAWLAGWLPNLTFGLTGCWLTGRVR